MCSWATQVAQSSWLFFPEQASQQSSLQQRTIHTSRESHSTPVLPIILKTRLNALLLSLPYMSIFIRLRKRGRMSVHNAYGTGPYGSRGSCPYTYIYITHTLICPWVGEQRTGVHIDIHPFSTCHLLVQNNWRCLSHCLLYLSSFGLTQRRFIISLQCSPVAHFPFLD
jgi:hypothetical protein